MKGYITEEECQLSTAQKQAIKELLELTGGRQGRWLENVITFVAAGPSSVSLAVHNTTINLKINWIDHATAFEIISLLVNRRDK